MNDIKVGMIVRYTAEWSTPEERKYLHLVRENRLNPCTNQMTRWLIETLNSSLTIGNPTETVETEMIEPTGFTIEDILKGVTR